MFLICLIFQYLDNKYIKTLLNSNKILSENFQPISGIKLVSNKHLYFYLSRFQHKSFLSHYQKKKTFLLQYQAIFHL